MISLRHPIGLGLGAVRSPGVEAVPAIGHVVAAPLLDPDGLIEITPSLVLGHGPGRIEDCHPAIGHVDAETVHDHRLVGVEAPMRAQPFAACQQHLEIGSAARRAPAILPRDFLIEIRRIGCGIECQRRADRPEPEPVGIPGALLVADDRRVLGIGGGEIVHALHDRGEKARIPGELGPALVAHLRQERDFVLSERTLRLQQSLDRALQPSADLAEHLASRRVRRDAPQSFAQGRRHDDPIVCAGGPGRPGVGVDR